MAVIRQHTRGRGIPDEISEVIGSPYYAEQHYDKRLRDRLLGPHSTDLVGVSRFYLTITPPVVVDFESPEEPFRVEEKRKFFFEQGVVYVPVFLREILTRDQFAERLKGEREALSSGYLERALTEVTVEEWMAQGETLALIEKEALVRASTRRGKAFGASYMRIVKRCKQEVADEFRRAARHGKLGPFVRRIESALVARG